MNERDSTFDVMVVGAGPAGGHCARLLARAEMRTLLIERRLSHEQNAFSSAAAPNGTVERFNLPQSVIECEWNALSIHSSKERANWQSGHALGVVFSFARLREFLASDARKNGARIELGQIYLGHQRRKQNYLVRIVDARSSQERTIICRWIVDATGPKRAVMEKQFPKLAQDLRVAVGIEHVIEVSRPSHTLEFILGRQHAPGGYGWIFPADPGQLKVGICAYQAGSTPLNALKANLEKLLKGFIKEDFKVIKTHGGTLRFSPALKDRYNHGRVLAIGDAVSAVNPLGGEGIRHGLFSAEFAARAITRKEKFRFYPLIFYRWRMKMYCGFKWRISGLLMEKVYARLSDRGVDRGVRLMRRLSREKMMRVLFDYSHFAVAGVVASAAIARVKRRWRDE